MKIPWTVLKLQSGHDFVITKKYIYKSYASCTLHVIIWCLVFIWSFMKISWKALNLQSGHDFVTETIIMSLNPKVGRHNNMSNLYENHVAGLGLKLYTTLPHNLIKEKLINLIEWTFKREGSPYIACNERQAFFTSEDTKQYKLWSCQNVCEALIYLLDNIYIRFGTKLYRQIVGILMGTNCAPLVADLFLFCYERDFMTSLTLNKLKLLKHLNLQLDIWTTF